MNLINPFLIKKYERILEKNPKSKVFCPLAQAYRLGGDLAKAKEICLEGLNHNPNYSTAYITLAKIYKDEQNPEKSLETLNKAKDLSPDSYQIYLLQGEIYQEQKDLEKTLAAFKMVLFIRPWDNTVKTTVQHLEKVLSQQESDIIKSDKETQEESKNDFKNYKKSKKVLKLQKFLSRIETRAGQIGKD